MTENKQDATKTKNGPQPRASVTFPPGLYKALEGIAKRKKVSIAWVVRDAAEKYVASRLAEQ